MTRHGKNRYLHIPAADMHQQEDKALSWRVAPGICRTGIAFVDTWYDGDEPPLLGHEGRVWWSG